MAISDGHTRIKARLSQAAVAVLEDEAGTKFTEDMTNDVFRPKSITVVSTTFGTPDGFVQLDIDDIEYEHHLRRAEGQPTPVEEHEGVRILLDDINKIRCADLPSANPPEFETVQAAFVSSQPTVKQQFQQPKRPQGSAADPVAVAESPPATQTNGFRAGIPSFQTQRSIPRKHLGPSLGTDGFEMEYGLNLDRPVQAASNDAPNTTVGPRSQTSAAPNTRLLGLLGGGKGQKIPPPPSPPLQQSPVAVSENAARTQISGCGVQGLDATFDIGLRLLSSAAPQSAQLPPEQTQASLRSSGRSAVPCGRRPIPTSQRKLLERKESWLPPIPGHSFPSPNIPVELLTRWNTVMRNAPKSLQTSPVKSDANEIEADDELQSDVAESSDSSDSDRAFGPSQWSPSPPPALPPDSSFENVIHRTQQDDLEVAAPRALPAKKAAVSTPLRNRLPAKPVVVTSPRDHSSGDEVAGSDGTVRSQQMQGSSAHGSPLSRVQRSRPSQERYDSQQYRTEESPFNRRPPSPQVVLDREVDEHLSRPVVQRSSSGALLTQPGSIASRRGAANNHSTTTSPPSTCRRPTANNSPPTGPRAMNVTHERDQRRQLQMETPSRAQPQDTVNRSAESSRWPNMPMTVRRPAGLRLDSSPPGRASTTPDGMIQADATPGTTQHPSTSLVPATQMSAARFRPVEETYDRRYTPRHVDRYIPSQRSPIDQHPDDRYRKVRRDHMWHSRRRDW